MRISLLLTLLLLNALPLRAGDTVETRILLWQHGGTKEKLVCAWDPVTASLRIEQPDRRFGVIWREKGDFFIGLEERDAQYWEFDWPKIAAAVGGKNGAAYAFQEPIIDSSAGALGKAPAPVTETPPSAIVWKLKSLPVEGKADQASIWSGMASATRDVEARVLPQPPSGLAMFWQRYARVCDLMRLVAVRELGPPDLTPLVASLGNLPAAARAPVMLSWIDGETTTDTLTLLDTKTEPRDPARFAPPAVFQKTTLATLEGLLEEAPAPKPKDDGLDRMETPPSPFKGM